MRAAADAAAGDRVEHGIGIGARQQALAAGKDIAGFARGLQRAGYATDPTYANEIASIANGPTLGKVLSAIGTTVAGPVGNAVGNAIGNALRR